MNFFFDLNHDFVDITFFYVFWPIFAKFEIGRYNMPKVEKTSYFSLLRQKSGHSSFTQFSKFLQLILLNLNKISIKIT